MWAVLVDCLFSDHLRSVFLIIIQYLYSDNIVRWRHVHLKKLLQIFVYLHFYDSYGMSYATLPTAVMKITEFERVQFLSLLLSTSLRSKKRKWLDSNQLPPAMIIYCHMLKQTI